jgi:hypothetical protein
MNARYLMITAVALLAIRSVGAAEIRTLSVPVDITWRAIGPVGDLTGQPIGSVGLEWESANLGWNTLVSYDDTDAAGWKETIEVIHLHEPFVRYWVDGTDIVGSSPAYFRRVIDIPGTPLESSFSFGVDDDATIYINGNVVFTDSDGLYSFFTGANVTPYLRSGPNLVAVKAHDLQGAQAIWGQLEVRYQVPELSSAMLVGLATLVASSFRFRRINRQLQPSPTG